MSSSGCLFVDKGFVTLSTTFWTALGCAAMPSSLVSPLCNLLNIPGTDPCASTLAECSCNGLGGTLIHVIAYSEMMVNGTGGKRPGINSSSFTRRLGAFSLAHASSLSCLVGKVLESNAACFISIWILSRKLIWVLAHHHSPQLSTST